ncbi:uncharacterized protein BHQ10_006061 [Talaromyces amestolkiae]|uniref:Uncharacterized protein n=1 Tax=Talaromyces amestolkiae TaxID=1196081 RepID=A0A364L2L2_TALAM|nr:uncharacterized protein BHQ10_006061 [Talaromyces amestolkiae]RAO70049.1 hypothetical protein BHQ10_006061 [Talaromyces amestolkiae]
MALSHLFYFICIAGALPIAIQEPPPAPNPRPGPEKWFEDNWWMVVGGIGLLGLLALIWRRLDKTETWKFWLWDFRRRGREAEYIELGETRERNLTASALQNHNLEGSGQQPLDDTESGETRERNLTVSALPNDNPEGSGQKPPGENETPIETEEGPEETNTFVVAGPSRTRQLDVREGTRSSSPKGKEPIRGSDGPLLAKIPSI